MFVILNNGKLRLLWFRDSLGTLGIMAVLLCLAKTEKQGEINMRKENRKMQNNEIPYQVWDDDRVASGFTASLVTPQECSAGYSEARHGFTLIELLVVVLIIGILAAVAVPQYQKAVVRGRVAAILPVLKNIREAQEVYYMDNGSYSNDVTQLDIELPAGWILEEGSVHDGSVDSFFRFDIANASNSAVAVYYCPYHTSTWENCEPKRDFQISYKYANADNYPNTRFCSVKNSSSLGTLICKNLSGKTTPDNGTAYFF